MIMKNRYINNLVSYPITMTVLRTFSPSPQFRKDYIAIKLNKIQYKRGLPPFELNPDDARKVYPFHIGKILSIRDIFLKLDRERYKEKRPSIKYVHQLFLSNYHTSFSASSVSASTLNILHCS